MPRTEAENQRLRDAQRAKIMESALKVFARKGMATTMADVAAAAEISQGLTYRYFENKEALFRALVEQVLQPDVVRTIDITGTPRERLSALMSSMFRMRREHPEIFQLVDHVVRMDDGKSSDLQGLMLKRLEMFHGLLKQLIVEGQATGEFVDDDPEALVTILGACLEGLTLLMLHSPERLQVSDKSIELIIMRMLKPDS